MILFGSLLILITVGINPFLNTESSPFAETAQTSLFLLRQSLSALAALLFLIGVIGLYLKQSKESGYFGFISFLTALTGGVLLFAHEWNQVFFISELASISPEMLERIDASDKSTIAALLSLIGFSLGTILFSISLLRAKVYSKIGPILVITGLFAIPIFSALLGESIGSVIGNGVLGLGFFFLGKGCMI